MHGLIHVARSRRHIFERFLWIGLVISAFGLAMHQALAAWQRYEKGPVVITVDKDYIHWKVDYPSVFICLQSKSSTAYKFLETFAAKHNISADVKELEKYVDDLLFSTYFTYSKLEAYANGTKQDLVPSNLYLELVNFTSARLNSNRGRKSKFKDTVFPKNVDDEYAIVLTEFGVCHCFHSELVVHFDIETFVGKTSNKTYREIKKTHEEKALEFTQKKMFDRYLLFVVGTNEMIDISSQFTSVAESVLMSFSVDIIEIVSDESVKNLKPSQRRCRFTHENQLLKYSPVYSYKLCRMDCRITLALKYCHCTPYYYKRKFGEPICNMSGMYCLSKYPELQTLIDQRTGKNLCPCSQNCNNQEVVPGIVSSGSFFMDTSVTVSFDGFPKERYRRSLIVTRTDLLIQVGGLFGLFLGCSMLSLIEIPYFLTLRFLWGVFGNRRIKVKL